ncbi:MAG: PAS domain-containing sensor histidine kinase [Alphaproteobacteria bacterium]|nr:PAS domain-containing sensor histidine kinase [Alphaproteobacteria bacterium]
MRNLQLGRRLSIWSTRVRLRHKLVIGLVLASVASALATYAALTRTPFFGNDPTTIMILSLLDLGFLIALGTIVTQRILSIWMRRRRNQAGSRLHVRMVSVFTLLAVGPGMLVAMFAAIFFYFGVEGWFSTHVRTSLNESLAVAQAYLEEHKQVLRADALSMANDLNRQAVLLSQDPVRFAQSVSAQAYLRNLTEVIVFDGSGKILARSGLSFALSFEPITDEMRQTAQRGDVVLVVSDNDDRVRALVRLDNFVDTYLFVGRPVEPKVLAHMATTQKAVSEYHQLEGKRFGLQVTISLIFVVVALLLLLAAVWFGLNFATRLVRPVSDLIGAADRVRGGDLTARVPEAGKEGDDELDHLSRAFNRMASQLENQRGDLIEANRQLDLRRRFTEAVLSGVSAGIIGLDSECRINLMNVSAASFFEVANTDALNGQFIGALAPEIQAILDVMPRGSRFSDGQVEIRRPGQPARTLLVRVSSELAGAEIRGYVVTFDDVSDLLSAQRKAAWADVARRIAHEIKNPLTPIQLSAERLRRKYAGEIKTDPEVFQTCTDTIVRHVYDIGRMVDEFSAFARMPAPVMKEHDLRDLCRQTTFLQSAGRADIRHTQDLPEQHCFAECDARQIGQALTNLLKNAAEAVDARPAPLTGTLLPGEIRIRLIPTENRITLSVEDNGKGLPVEERNSLTEPYVTTRTKGTGLGLAIVKKIMEDHHGELILADRPGGGAIVSLIWPRRQPQDDALSAEDESATDETGLPAARQA